MFPIHDLTGHVAGFGGRLLGPGEPKYLNSPETAVFSKGKMLYGLQRARNAIRRADRALLVEGYFDLVRLSIAGVEEVVAPLGTALTAEQAALIVRYSKHVFLLYDSDKAGLKATFRATDELLRHGADVRVVTLPAGDDPDTFARKAGREGVEKSLAGSVDAFERKVQVLERGGWFGDLHRRRRAIDHMLPTIRAAADPVTRDLYLARASEVTGVDRQVLLGEANEAREDGPRSGVRRPAPSPPRREGPPRRAVPAPARTAPGESAERDLVRVMLTVPAQVERVAERIGPGEFRDARYREIFEGLMRHHSADGPAAVAAELTSPAAAAYEALLAEPGAIVDVDRTISDCLASLETRSLEERSAEIQRLLVAATGSEKDRLLVEKQRIWQEIRKLTTGGPAA
jgi:DNA primase